jgi:hypothetical protein
VDSSGFIVPPPHLFPPREDTGTETARVPDRVRELPAFLPPAAATTAGDPAATGVRRWRLVLPGGHVVPLAGSVLIGRNPVAFGPWPDAQLVAVDDPASSVSKTHAAFEAGSDDVRVTDVHSTNGVVAVSQAGAETPLEPGVSAPVGEGAVVRLGRFSVRVERG